MYAAHVNPRGGQTHWDHDGWQRQYRSGLKRTVSRLCTYYVHIHEDEDKDNAMSVSVRINSTQINRLRNK